MTEKQSGIYLGEMFFPYTVDAQAEGCAYVNFTEVLRRVNMNRLFNNMGSLNITPVIFSKKSKKFMKALNEDYTHLLCSSGCMYRSGQPVVTYVHEALALYLYSTIVLEDNPKLFVDIVLNLKGGQVR